MLARCFTATGLPAESGNRVAALQGGCAAGEVLRPFPGDFEIVRHYVMEQDLARRYSSSGLSSILRNHTPCPSAWSAMWPKRSGVSAPAA